MDKKTKFPYFLFVEGRYMEHPKLESGDRKRMKVYAVDPEIDMDIDEIQDLLQEAMNVQDKIIHAKGKK